MIFTVLAGTLQIIGFFQPQPEKLVVIPAPLSREIHDAESNKRHHFVSYKAHRKNGELLTAITASIDGLEYRVISETDELCLKLMDQFDYDGNGTTDALISNNLTCGGNAAGDTFFFISYKGDGHFERTEEFGYSWDDPVIETWKGTRTVLITSNSEGAGNTKAEELRERYVLSAGKAVLVERSERKELVAIQEMRSDVFSSGDKARKEKLSFDIDNDGRNDSIEFEYWERWGRMNWSARFARGDVFESEFTCKRLGILQSISNGHRDLVCDHDTILKWTGDGYAHE